MRLRVELLAPSRACQYHTSLSSRKKSVVSKMLLHAIIFLQQFQGIYSTVSCIGEAGQQVDW